MSFYVCLCAQLLQSQSCFQVSHQLLKGCCCLIPAFSSCMFTRKVSNGSLFFKIYFFRNNIFQLLRNYESKVLFKYLFSIINASKLCFKKIVAAYQSGNWLFSITVSKKKKKLSSQKAVKGVAVFPEVEARSTPRSVHAMLRCYMVRRSFLLFEKKMKEMKRSELWCAKFLLNNHMMKQWPMRRWDCCVVVST